MKLVFQKKIAMKRKIYLFALLGLFLAATACQDYACRKTCGKRNVCR